MDILSEDKNYEEPLLIKLRNKVRQIFRSLKPNIKRRITFYTPFYETSKSITYRFVGSNIDNILIFKAKGNIAPLFQIVFPCSLVFSRVKAVIFSGGIREEAFLRCLL